MSLVYEMEIFIVYFLTPVSPHNLTAKLTVEGMSGSQSVSDVPKVIEEHEEPSNQTVTNYSVDVGSIICVW